MDDHRSIRRTRSGPPRAGSSASASASASNPSAFPTRHDEDGVARGGGFGSGGSSTGSSTGRTCQTPTSTSTTTIPFPAPHDEFGRVDPVRLLIFAALVRVKVGQWLARLTGVPELQGRWATERSRHHLDGLDEGQEVRRLGG